MERLVWVAFRYMFKGGVSEIIDKLHEIGATGVAPRAGEAGNMESKFVLSDIKAYLDAGFEVYPWTVPHPESIEKEAAQVDALMKSGAHGVLLDNGEKPWSTDMKAPNASQRVQYFRTQATKLGELIRKIQPNAFIGDAPWAMQSWHPDFPNREFDAWVDRRMPQLYSPEFSAEPDAVWWDRFDKDWAAFKSRVPVVPILTTYGKEHPSHPRGDWTEAECEAGMLRYSGCSWYTLEAMNSATKAVFQRYPQPQPSVQPREEPNPYDQWGRTAEQVLPEILDK